MRGLYGEYFSGNRVSEYGRKMGYVDYATLADAFDAVRNNDIIKLNVGYWEKVHGWIDNSKQIDELEEQIEELEEQIDTWSEMRMDAEEHVDDLTSLDDPSTMEKWQISFYSGRYVEYDRKITEWEDQRDDLGQKIDDLEYEQNKPEEVSQWFIVSDMGAEILMSWTDDIVYYNEELNMYLWGIEFLNVSWDQALTSIKINMGMDAMREEHENE